MKQTRWEAVISVNNFYKDIGMIKGDINTLKWQMGIMLAAIVGGGGSVSASEILRVCLVWLVFSR